MVLLLWFGLSYFSAAKSIVTKKAFQFHKAQPFSAVGPSASGKALQIHGGAIETSHFVNAVSAVMGIYGAQMLLFPSRMVTEHFHTSSDKYLDFWIRGTAASIGPLIYALSQLPVEIARNVALAWIAGIAFLYPFNAKFGYFSKLEVKYPMHYLPEVLMSVLIMMGLLSFGSVGETVVPDLA